MAEEMTVKIRSIDGRPIRVDELAKHIWRAGCEIVAVPTTGANVRINRPRAGWPPLISTRKAGNPKWRDE